MVTEVISAIDVTFDSLVLIGRTGCPQAGARRRSGTKVGASVIGILNKCDA